MVIFVHFEVEVICVRLLIISEMPFSVTEHEDSKPLIPWTIAVKDPEPVLSTSNVSILLASPTSSEAFLNIFPKRNFYIQYFSSFTSLGMPS